MSTPSRNNHRLLIIDDDEDLSGLLEEYFARFGHRLMSAPTAAEGRLLLARHRPDLVILDIMLPDTDGLTLCREIRTSHDLPIIMLTARGEVSDRVLGLELGADDYLSKPFEPRELVARIESVLRRTSHRDNVEVMSCDGLRLEIETRRVERDHQLVDLTTMEFELLRVLMQSRGRVMSRDRLIELLRGFDADVFDRSIDMLVSRLRSKLGEEPRSPRFIKTVWRTGYQFIGSSSPT